VRVSIVYFLVIVCLFAWTYPGASLSLICSLNGRPPPKELTEFVTRRTHLSRQAKKLCLMQCTFCPGALQRLATAVPKAVEAERIPLFLPSAPLTTESLPLLSAPGLAAAEARLHDSQCSEALDQICHALTVKKRLSTCKTLNAQRQHQNTRARRLVGTQQRKVDLAWAHTGRRGQLSATFLA
jgi:hypothetical protein